ncbi:Cobyrinic acid A,C-diamide synthase [Roseovarius albus]|uniref:Hydrogenobyrinate a,c-diamide synthase n=1 Tax=Roseovarius albus TaxID=1247867 RepID=A0A1X6ZD49_9RHOB|nr:cobyrinate a,c-diamide synthase [Roseovarius albus]SLN47775.1 Cobyrinic acid A,C-diamide synthase [Roseovarius albus]
MTPETQGHGLIIAAPSSGSGKTTVTLGLLRALRETCRYGSVRGAKSGPDYIDPRFHEAACGQPSFNLDAWAMSPAHIKSLATGPGLMILEGAMGLFDGAPPTGKGASADLARLLNLPVVLVVDAARMAHSIAPMVQGFAKFDSNIKIAGVILNRVGSDRHKRMLEVALAPTGIPVLGAIPRSASLELPSRHLGLVQAGEHKDLNAFLDQAAKLVADTVDLDAIQTLAQPIGTIAELHPEDLSDTTIAIARDEAFAFSYPHELQSLQQRGATLNFFSPLNNDPVPKANRVYLPGGYPELHSERLASAETFLASLRKAAETTEIYGECGGYMTLGTGLTDANGTRHKMAGLLPLETSFAERRLHLGYRTLNSLNPDVPGKFAAHEFHYATTLSADGPPLFSATDAEGTTLPDMGLTNGNVSGSFAHIIAPL